MISSGAGSAATGQSSQPTGPKLGPISPKGPMIGADGTDYAASGNGAQIGIQPVNGNAAAEMALGGADVSASIKHGVQHDLSPRVGALSHEDLLGARAGAIKTEMVQQSSKIMDEAAQIGMPAPPLLKVADLHAWRAERQAAATQDMGQAAGMGHSSPYPDPFALPTPKMR